MRAVQLCALQKKLHDVLVGIVMMGSLQIKQHKDSGGWWLIVVLWFFVLLSSVMVIGSSHQTRIKVNQLAELREQQDKLHVVWSQYLLEESAWASYGRIERVAIEQLLMQIPPTQQMVMVKAREE